ncbi:MAG: RpiB/LacA/LacB family sugar-phosphate isomerase [Patescibacteria group bacterium]
MKKIYISADHRGFELKNELTEHLLMKNFEVEDLGNKTLDPNDDYPLFAHKVASKVSTDPKSLGIVICGSGIGVSITANRHKGVRSAVGHSKEEIEKACEHDHLNILAISADSTTSQKAIELVDTFLNSSWSDEDRHKRRVEQIDSF